jgi:hypothetical protein
MPQSTPKALYRASTCSRVVSPGIIVSDGSNVFCPEGFVMTVGAFTGTTTHPVRKRTQTHNDERIPNHSVLLRKKLKSFVRGIPVPPAATHAGRMAGLLRKVCDICIHVVFAILLQKKFTAV